MTLEGSYSTLFSGVATGGSPLATVMTHLGESIKTYIREAHMISHADSSVLEIYGPFLGRALLEATLTSITGRLDPFRLLAIRQIQLSGTLDLTKPNKLAYRWQGDVLPEKKTEWGQDLNIDNYSRALTGEGWDRFAWQQAFEDLLDILAAQPQKGWVADLRSIEPETFIPRWKSELSKLYSTLSKGIHIEFVIPTSAQLSASDIQVVLADVVYRTSVLGAAAHMIDHCCYNLDRSIAAEKLLAVERGWI